MVAVVLSNFVMKANRAAVWLSPPTQMRGGHIHPPGFLRGVEAYSSHEAQWALKAPGELLSADTRAVKTKGVEAEERLRSSGARKKSGGNSNVSGGATL